MIFETLVESLDAGELLLCDGGLLRWHLRRDGQATIYEILVAPDRRRYGIGTDMVRHVMRKPGVRSLRARCPDDLRAANAFWRALGFRLVDFGLARSGRVLNTYELHIA